MPDNLADQKTFTAGVHVALAAAASAGTVRYKVEQDPAYACAAGARALVVVTEWDQFRALDLERLAKCVALLVLVDLRNVYRPDDAAKAGLSYTSVGIGGHASGTEAASAAAE